ncbi:MAG: PLP-dependent aminotransferase family protein [Nakamurella sp.]
MTPATPRMSAATFSRRLGAGPAIGPGPAYRLLADRIRGAVLDGRLSVSSGLPSERDLATGLAVSRTTVAAAYALLREEGWLESRRGSGSRLRLPSAATEQTGRGIGPAGLFGHPAPGREDEIDLATASLPAPIAALQQAVAAAVDDLPRHAAGTGYSPFGVPALRQAIAQHYCASGVPTAAEQILVTSGAQHAFTLAVQELSAPGDRVMVECPTYPVALDAVRGARRIPDPIGLPGPDSGHVEPWDCDLIAAAMRQTAPRLAYLIPDFQNPTGALMNEETRQRIVRVAQASNTLLLIDESFRDVPFPGHEHLPPRMAAFDNGLRVLSLGSLSKSVWGGLRIGWIRGASAMIDRLATSRALGDMSGPVLEQLIAVHLLADPQDAFDHQRRRLSDGAAVLSRALAERLPSWRTSDPHGGGSLWVALPGPFATEMARLAHTVGVRIAPGPRFGPDGTMESYLRLPFTQPPDTLITAVQRLASVAERPAGRRRSDLPGWLA